MSRTIVVDGDANYSFVVSDAEYAGIDWGSSSDDTVFINLEYGGAASLNWTLIGVVTVSGATPPPGTYPGWHVDARGPHGAVIGLHVNDATKDALLAVLASEDDAILEFTTLQGFDVKMPSRNATAIAFRPADYVVPV